MSTKKEMYREIKKLADFLSLRMTRIVLIALLALNYLLSIQYRLGPYSIYALCIAFILPPAVTVLWRDGIQRGKHKNKNKTGKMNYHFTCLLSHYHFSPEGLAGESVTFYLLALVLLLWQRRNMSFFILPAWCAYCPVFLAILITVLRFLLYVFYRIFLPIKIIGHNY